MCSKPCGIGIQTRMRTCNNPPASNGGADCVGNPVGDRFCVVSKCPGWFFMIHFHLQHQKLSARAYLFKFKYYFKIFNFIFTLPI